MTKLMSINFVHEVSERGLGLCGSVPALDIPNFRIGDIIELRCKDGASIETTVLGLELSSPAGAGPEQCIMCVLVGTDLPVKFRYFGTEVWLRD